MVENYLFKTPLPFSAARTHTCQVCRIVEPAGCATPYELSIVAKEISPCFPSGSSRFVTNLFVTFPKQTKSKNDKLEIHVFVDGFNPGTLFD